MTMVTRVPTSMAMYPVSQGRPGRSALRVVLTTTASRSFIIPLTVRTRATKQETRIESERSRRRRPIQRSPRPQPAKR